MKITEQLKYFLFRQDVAIVGTLTSDKHIHTSIKGILDINQEITKIVLIDLFHGHTYRNIKLNPEINLTVMSEPEFLGYSIQGKAKLVPIADSDARDITLWEQHLNSRICDRMRLSLRTEGKGNKEKILKTNKDYYSLLFIKPKNLIEVTIDNIVDLSLIKMKEIK